MRGKAARPEGKAEAGANRRQSQRIGARAMPVWADSRAAVLRCRQQSGDVIRLHQRQIGMDYQQIAADQRCRMIQLAVQPAP